MTQYNVLGYYEHAEGYFYIKFFHKFTGQRKFGGYKQFQVVRELDSSWKPYVFNEHNKLHTSLEVLGKKVVSYKPSVNMRRRITLLKTPPDTQKPYLVELVTTTSKHRYGFFNASEIEEIKHLTLDEMCYKLAVMKQPRSVV